MPSYKGHEWGDESYDAIDWLIDNDPIGLGHHCRLLQSLLNQVVTTEPPNGVALTASFRDRVRSVLAEGVCDE